jgi:hypothetical protein
MELSLILDTLDDLSKENKHLTELTEQIDKLKTRVSKLSPDVLSKAYDEARTLRVTPKTEESAKKFVESLSSYTPDAQQILGKRLPDYLNSNINSYLGKSLQDFANPYSSQFSDSTIPSQAVVPYASQAVVPYASQAVVPYASQAVVPQTSQAVVPYASQAVVPQTSQAVVPYASQAVVPYASQPVVPQTSQAVVPYASQPVVPQTSQAVVPYASQEVPYAQQGLPRFTAPDTSQPELTIYQQLLEKTKGLQSVPPESAAVASQAAAQAAASVQAAQAASVQAAQAASVQAAQAASVQAASVQAVVLPAYSLKKSEVSILQRSKISKVNVRFGQNPLSAYVTFLQQDNATIQKDFNEFKQTGIDAIDVTSFEKMASTIETQFATLNTIISKMGNVDTLQAVELYQLYDKEIASIRTNIHQQYKTLAAAENKKKTLVSDQIYTKKMEQHKIQVSLDSIKDFLSTLAFVSEQVVKDMETCFNSATISQGNLLISDYIGKQTSEDYTTIVSTTKEEVGKLIQEITDMTNLIWKYKREGSLPTLSIKPLIQRALHILKQGANLLRNACLNRIVDKMYVVLSSTYDFSQDNMIVVYPKLCSIYDMMWGLYITPGLTYEDEFNKVKVSIQSIGIDVPVSTDTSSIVTYDSTFKLLQTSSYSPEVQEQINAYLLRTKKIYDRCLAILDDLEIVKMDTQEILEECELGNSLMEDKDTLFGKSLKYYYDLVSTLLLQLTDFQESFQDGVQELLEATTRYKSNISLPTVSRNTPGVATSVSTFAQQKVEQSVQKLSSTIVFGGKLKRKIIDYRTDMLKELDNSMTTANSIQLSKRVIELCLMDANDALTITKTYMRKYGVELPNDVPKYIDETFDELV